MVSLQYSFITPCTYLTIPNAISLGLCIIVSLLLLVCLILRCPLSCRPDQEFLHSKDLLHGNIRAHSVLITKEFTAKLWGLHGVYTRKNQGATQRDDPSMKKWQAPELLAKRPAGQSSDV